MGWQARPGINKEHVNNLSVYANIRAPSGGHNELVNGLCIYGNEQALVCLSTREIVDASTWCTFYCKNANNRFFSNCFRLIYLTV